MCGSITGRTDGVRLWAFGFRRRFESWELGVDRGGVHRTTVRMAPPLKRAPASALWFRRRRSGRFRLRRGRLGTGEIAGLDDHDLRQVHVLLQSGLYLRRRQCGDLRFEVAVPLHRALEEEILCQT